MKIKCPSCGAQHSNPPVNGKYTCEYCGEVFTEEESKAVHREIKHVLPTYTPGPSASEIAARFAEMVGANSRAGGFNSAKNPRSAEEIYKSAIDGVCCIYGDCGNSRYSGSGFLVDDRGYIITNCHVVTDERHVNLLSNLTAIFDGKKYRIKPVAVCKQDVIDCALMRLVDPTPKSIKALPVGNSDEVVHGQRVFAIGNSLGEGLCITSGIISDLHRIVFNCEAFMSDVATNHGNSGGPLFDEDGKVIAICVAGIDGAKGMNYFIPINLVMKAVGNKIR